MSGKTFARYLDSQYKDYEDDLPLWIQLALASEGPTLELGCGTGRVLEALASQNMMVAGIDNEPAMLARARGHLFPHFEPRVQLIQDDIRTFHLERRFSLALAVCNVIAQLPLAQATQIFERTLTHLNPGGMLAIDLPNPKTALEDSIEDDPELVAEFLDIDSQHPIQLYSLNRPGNESDQQEVIWYYDELSPDGMVDRLEVAVTYYLHTPQVIQTELQRAGFTRIEFLGEYSSAPLLSSSSRLIVLARAP